MQISSTNERFSEPKDLLRRANFGRAPDKKQKRSGNSLWKRTSSSNSSQVGELTRLRMKLYLPENLV